jgi:hypothetical protein
MTHPDTPEQLRGGRGAGERRAGGAAMASATIGTIRASRRKRGPGSGSRKGPGRQGGVRCVPPVAAAPRLGFRRAQGGLCHRRFLASSTASRALLWAARAAHVLHQLAFSATGPEPGRRCRGPRPLPAPRWAEFCLALDGRGWLRPASRQRLARSAGSIYCQTNKNRSKAAR